MSYKAENWYASSHKLYFLMRSFLDICLWVFKEEKEATIVISTFSVNVTESLDKKKDNNSSLGSIKSQNIENVLKQSQKIEKIPQWPQN